MWKCHVIFRKTIFCHVKITFIELKRKKNILNKHELKWKCVPSEWKWSIGTTKWHKNGEESEKCDRVNSCAIWNTFIFFSFFVCTNENWCEYANFHCYFQWWFWFGWSLRVCDHFTSWSLPQYSEFHLEYSEKSKSFLWIWRDQWNIVELTYWCGE